MKRLIKGLFAALLFQSVHAFADIAGATPSVPVYVKYVECTGEKGAKIELYANPEMAESRPALVTLYGFAYLGEANKDLTSFSGAAGAIQLKVSLVQDARGMWTGGVVTGPNFTRVLTACDDGPPPGGGSVSVHN